MRFGNGEILHIILITLQVVPFRMHIAPGYYSGE